MWSTFSALRSQISEITREAVTEGIDILKDGSTEVTEALKDANLSPQEIEKIHMERRITYLENEISTLNSKLQGANTIIASHEVERKKSLHNFQKISTENEELKSRISDIELRLSSEKAANEDEKAAIDQLYKSLGDLLPSAYELDTEPIESSMKRWDKLLHRFGNELQIVPVANRSRGLVDISKVKSQGDSEISHQPTNAGTESSHSNANGGGNLQSITQDRFESLSRELETTKEKLIELESRNRTEWSSLYSDLLRLFSEGNESNTHTEGYVGRAKIMELIQTKGQSKENPGHVSEPVDDSSTASVKKFISEFATRNQLKLRSLSMKPSDWSAHFAHIIDFNETMRKKIAQLEDESVRIIQKMQQLDIERARLTNENTDLEEEIRKVRLSLKSEFESVDKERKLLKQKEAQWQQILEGVQGDLSQQKSDRLRLKDEISKNEELTSKVSSLTNQCKQLQAALETTSRARQAQFNEEMDEVHKRLESLEQEKAKLQEKLFEVEQSRQSENQRKDAVIMKLEAGIQGETTKNKLANEKLTQMVAKVDSENRALKTELVKTKEELDTLTKIKSKLEIVVAQFQSDLEAQVDSKLALMKQQLNSWKEKYTEKEKELLLLAAKYSDYEEMKQSNSLLKLSSTSREEEIKGLRAEVGKLRKGLEDALAQLAAAARRDENLIDRRLVNQLIVSYFEVGSKKNEVLDIMSKILKFSEEEKIKVGLVSRPGSWYSFISHTLQYTPEDNSAGSLADLWVEYLKKEAEGNRNS